jgi:hypothetical protein
LQVSLYGRKEAPLRVLFLCGQHGDERAIRNAVWHFTRSCVPSLLKAVPFLQLAVIGDANPDGAAARTRGNAQGIDLNRDHLMLRAPETQAIHRFVRTWRPHLIVDLHNYPSRRKGLLEQGLRLGWDVCLDIPTIPAANCLPKQIPFLLLFGALDGVSRQKGFQFGRYGLLGEDGSFRYGTPQLGDARNTLTLRYEVPTLLLEMRNPIREEGVEDRSFLLSATGSALWELCHWAGREAEYLWGYSRSSAVAARPGARMALGFRRGASEEFGIPVQILDSGERAYFAVQRDQREIKGRRHRRLAARYFLEAEDWPWLELVRQHGLIVHKRAKNSYWEVPVEQQGGRLVALLLDGDSVYRRRLEGHLS